MGAFNDVKYSSKRKATAKNGEGPPPDVFRIAGRMVGVNFRALLGWYDNPAPEVSEKQAILQAKLKKLTLTSSGVREREKERKRLRKQSQSLSEREEEHTIVQCGVTRW